MANYLLIPDLQVPYENPRALEFCAYLKRHYKIENENVYNLGDEVDQYFGSLFDKDINAKHTANDEIRESIEKLQQWYAIFPKMKLVESNHGNRWKKRALKSQIPSQMIVDYRKLIQAPDTWLWKKNWVIDCKHRFGIEHGDDWSGPNPGLACAMAYGHSMAVGHHHSKCGVEFFKTAGLYGWGVTGGSLIDFSQFAFDYARSARMKPVSAAVVIVNDGAMPVIVPLG